MARSIDADLAFIDPPYDFGGWEQLLGALSPGSGFVVAESAAVIAAPEGWDEVRAKRYGRTWVTFLARHAP